MPINPKRTLNELKELRTLTSDENGAQRVAWTDTWIEARKWFEGKLKDLPVEHHYDSAGNQWVTLPGKSDKALIIGSHLDSVPNGGWLDGSLGVLTALEILRRFAEEFDGEPPVTIRVVDWADEEGARFGRSLFGSSAFSGTALVEADQRRFDDQGVSLKSAMARCGYVLDSILDATAEQANACAYLELHIEQGPILEQSGLPLGVVSGTKGVERHLVTFLGQEAHSGSTPMSVRQDALAAAAKLALEVYPIANKHPHAVCTVGSLKTHPGIVTAVVGRCEASLDQRDIDPTVLACMLEEAQLASKKFASEFGCSVSWSKIFSIASQPFHDQLTVFCEESILDFAEATLHLPSGPLHDAAEVSLAGIPTAMMFVQSLKGISHNKIEDTQEVHLELAIRAMDRLADKTVEWILRNGI